MNGLSETLPDEVREAIEMRRDIEMKFREVGLDPVRWLTGFDERCLNIERKRFAHGEAMKAVTSNRKMLISAAIDEQGWDVNEREREYFLYGFTGGLENASTAQIEYMFYDYIKTRMIRKL